MIISGLKKLMQIFTEKRNKISRQNIHSFFFGNEVLIDFFCFHSCLVYTILNFKKEFVLRIIIMKLFFSFRKSNENNYAKYKNLTFDF